MSSVVVRRYKKTIHHLRVRQQNERQHQATTGPGHNKGVHCSCQFLTNSSDRNKFPGLLILQGPGRLVYSVIEQHDSAVRKLRCADTYSLSILPRFYNISKTAQWPGSRIWGIEFNCEGSPSAAPGMAGGYQMRLYPRTTFSGG